MRQHVSSATATFLHVNTHGNHDLGSHHVASRHITLRACNATAWLQRHAREPSSSYSSSAPTFTSYHMHGAIYQMPPDAIYHARIPHFSLAALEVPYNHEFKEEYGTVRPVPNHDGTECFQWDETLWKAEAHFRVGRQCITNS